jgi:ECF sigma factor
MVGSGGKQAQDGKRFGGRCSTRRFRGRTNLLLRWGRGESSVLEQLTPIIYEDLLRMARARLSHENRECTLQPTALVHEAYVRLADQKKLKAENPPEHRQDT